MEEITFANVQAEVRRLVAADPDHVYRTGAPLESMPHVSCYYSAASPGAVEACLFGVSLANLGMEGLDKHEGVSVDELLFEYSSGISTYEANWLRDVQEGQDRGQTWSLALAAADESWPAVRA